MPNITPTNYLQETYKILAAEIPDIFYTKDSYKEGNNINTSAVFTAIDDKIKKAEQNSESELSKFQTEWKNFKGEPENSETCKGLNNISINTLIVNPSHKNVVARLIKRINPEKPVFDETAALKQQLQEFFELSRLADYASYDAPKAVWNKKKLLILGAMAKLQLCFVIDNLEKFFIHKKDNQETRAIAATIISYLDQSAIAKGYPSTNTGLGYFDTNLEAVKTSLAEDKQSLQSAFDVYLNNMQINQNEEINDDDEIFYDALEEQDEGENEDEFCGALSLFEVETGVESALPKDKNEGAYKDFEETISFPKKDKNPSNLEKLIRLLKTYIFNIMEHPTPFNSSLILLVTLIIGIEILQKTRQEATAATDSKVNPKDTQNFSNNPHGFYNSYLSQKREIAPRFNRLVL